MHLRVSAAGDPSTWAEGYTDSAAAVRYWWLTKRRGVLGSRLDVDSVRSAHTRSGQRIEVRLDDTVRYLWLASSDEVPDGVENAGTPQAPAAPSGNEFLPSRPADLADDAPWWSKSPVAPTDTAPTVWRAESTRGSGGVWSDWDKVISYQTLGGEPHRDVRSGTEIVPVAPSPPSDGSAYVVTLDRYAEGLPAGFNPGDPEDPLRGAYEADAVSSRYGVSGSISAADDPERVEEELDFAWAGSVVEQGGMLCFRPGADGASVGHDLGEAALLRSPTAAKRLVSTMLRASRASRSYRYRVAAGDAGAWLSLRAGQQVTVTDADRGLAGASLLVTGSSLAPDTGTVELELVEQGSLTFADAVELPVPRAVAQQQEKLRPPFFLRVRESVETSRDGAAVLRLLAVWKPETIASTELQWRIKDPLAERPDWRDAETLFTHGYQAYLDGVRVGVTYEVRARHVSSEDEKSEWTDPVSATVLGDREAMAAPAGLKAS